MSSRLHSQPLTYAGIPLLVHIDRDPQARPEHFDSHGAADVAAFDAGRWQFVTVSVTVDIPDTAIAVTTSGIEYGDLGWVQISPQDIVDGDAVTLAAEDCRTRLAVLAARTAPTARHAPPLLLLDDEQAATALTAVDLAERHFRQAADEAAAGTTRPATPPTATETVAGVGDRAGVMDVEPTPEGYRRIAARFTAEADRYTRLAALLRRHTQH